jgi:hypothetical protein
MRCTLASSLLLFSSRWLGCGCEGQSADQRDFELDLPVAQSHGATVIGNRTTTASTAPRRYSAALPAASVWTPSLWPLAGTG